MSTVSVDMVRAAYESLRESLEAAGRPLPQNLDRLRRHLDCAVIERLHAIYERQNDLIETVRVLFSEGQEIYPGSGFQAKTHIQIAVRNPDCIKGVFKVPSAHLLS